MDKDEKEFIKATKDAKRMEVQKRMGSFLGAFGKLVPKGIKSQDSLVRNSHLYIPGRKGKTKLY